MHLSWSWNEVTQLIKEKQRKIQNIQLWKDKWCAFFRHFLISLFFLGGTLSLLAWWDYRDFLFWGDGGFEAIKIALVVDVILGPVLVFLIYEKNKKNLKLDYLLVLMLQLSAWSYGMFMLHDQRPVALVWNQFFHPVTQHQIIQTQKKEDPLAKPQFYGGKMPVYVYDLPKDPVKRQKRAMEAMALGRPFYVDQSYWVRPQSQAFTQAMNEAYSPGQSNLMRTENAKKVFLSLEKRFSKVENLKLTILQMRYKNMLCAFDLKKKEILDCESANFGSLVEY